MSSLAFRVVANINPGLRLMHLSFIYTGLFELAAVGEIELDLSWQPAAESSVVTLHVSRARGGRTRRVCFDIHDRSYAFSGADLRECHTYFKRSYHAPDLAQFTEPIRTRIRPFGPVFVTAAAHQRNQLALSWLWRTLSTGQKLRQTIQYYIDYRRLPTPSQFERPAAEPAPRKVLLQTRLWTEREVTGAPAAGEINAERIAIVRALRDGLGERFIGGLMPTPLAREQHPDLVCEWDTKRAAYLATMHGCAIGIYTRGLHWSTAWKLGEYLASSMAIVASGLRNELPHPLAESRNILTFSTPEQCLAHCRRLLEEPDFLHTLREENWAYYQQHSSPAAMLRDCLAKACS